MAAEEVYVARLGAWIARTLGATGSSGSTWIPKASAFRCRRPSQTIRP